MQLNYQSIQRRQFLSSTVGFVSTACVASCLLHHGDPLYARPQATDESKVAESDTPFALRFIVGSCMYGYASIDEILPEVAKSHAVAIDLWPKVHGNQREQLDEMGEATFAEKLNNLGLQLGCITQYKLGPFALQNEMALCKRLGCQLIVTGAEGPRGLTGSELKRGVQDFVEKMKPHVEAAEKLGVTIAIENHANNLIESEDSMKWLAELSPSRHLALAFAPYHLPQEPLRLADLIHALGESIAMFYMWQHGNGCMQAQPKESELLQMPGRGPLDFTPLLAALRDIRYQGWTEIFMHPFPRGVPILDSATQVTDEINRAREHLQSLMLATSNS